jgi:alpha-methylacyl-CoA racemase
MSLFYSFYGSGVWANERESNLLDGAAHFYDTYECKDGKYIAVACIEDKFYKEMLDKLEITDEKFSKQFSKDIWPELKSKLGEKFLSKNRDEWAMIFKNSDACITPILDLDEAPKHEHNKSRSTFTERDGVVQPNPSPRFSETPLEIKSSPKKIGEDNIVISEKYNINL